MIDGLLIAAASLGFSAGWVVCSIYHTNKRLKELESKTISTIFIED